MAITTLKVPEITNNFNKIDKIIWFNVSDVNGTYSINLFITPSQSLDTTISVFNYVTKEEHFTKIYPKSSNSGIISANYAGGISGNYTGGNEGIVSIINCSNSGTISNYNVFFFYFI